MKKIVFIFVLIFLYFIIMDKKLSTAFIEKIDLGLLDNELAVIFLSSDSYKTTLLMDKDKTVLVALDIKNSKNLQKSINRFTDKKIDYVFFNKSILSLDIDYAIRDILNDKVDMGNYIILKNNNLIEISNNKYNFCIYDVGSNDNIENCDFIYFIDMVSQINLKENLKAVFYEKNIASRFKENTYIKWIDNYELSSDAYNILKLSNNNYDIMTIPNEN